MLFFNFSDKFVRREKLLILRIKSFICYDSYGTLNSQKQCLSKLLLCIGLKLLTGYLRNGFRPTFEKSSTTVPALEELLFLNINLI